uniref:RNA polymerase sigma factor n=1 Tax=Agathobacter sp. TaxID=2021311 RepID=UPI004056BC84
MYTENQLIRKVKKSEDRKAADELIHRYYREIYAFAYRQTADSELSMDLTQEIFITVLKGIPLFEEKKAAFRTWLYAIASNKITDYYRSKYHKHQMLAVCTEELDETYATEEDLIEKIYHEQLMQKVMAVIVEYGNEWVRLFQMKVFLDKTFVEIAAELHLSENTVKTRYYAMLKRLRREMQNEK